jgi:GH15 family glucan-1,4-alpha-glucosidase
MAKLSYEQLLEQHLKILKDLQYDSGLFAASKKDVGTGYNKSWLRDNFYECLAFEILGDWDTVEKTYDSVLNIFLKHEEKIDWAIANKPSEAFQYIHARFNPQTFDEYWEEWGNKQNDAIGAILFRVGELEQNRKGRVLENKDRFRIVQKLVYYLQSIEYWNDPDNGMWEEYEEIHASSIGACVAGLKAVDKIEGIEVPDDMIVKGERALEGLLPRESDTKFTDLSLLSLIYPYHVVSDEMRDQILENLEYHLLRKRGVIRYKGDQYYNKNPDGYSEEAEWVFGLDWLAIIYQEIGNLDKAKELIENLVEIDTKEGLPELYFSNSEQFNENTPLGWTESLFIVALYEMNNKIGN